MDDWPPMHRAAEEGDLERVRQLLDGGVSVSSRVYYDLTPLHLAAARGRYEVVKFFSSLPECDLSLKDHFGFTALHLAVRWGRYEVVDFLSNLPQCDLNSKDVYGRTPLMLAASVGTRSVVDLLLQRGAQVNCPDYSKHTLLHRASSNNWEDLVHSILNSGEIDINAANSCGDTPLTFAVMEDNKDCTALLIRAGADVHRSDTEKRTALHVAAYHGSPRVVQVLLEKEGLDLINLQNIYGGTPLHDACREGHSEVIKQLLVAGADATLKNNKGETALNEGIRREKLTLEEFRLFVHYGAFLKDCDYVRISQNPVLKENVLKDVSVCTQSIVNKFHRQSLPALNSISYFARNLPCIDSFKLKARQVDEVENSVKSEIKRNTFCNLVKAHPMALSALCVLSLITCQSATKRSASPDSNSPFKKLHA